MLEFKAHYRAGSFTLEAAFSAGPGVTALFGRSGAGKSTVLGLIAGLARPAEGRIAVGARVLFDSAAGIDLPAHRRRVGYVFQDSRLLPHLSVRQNLLYGRFFSRSPRGGVRLSLAQVVELLGVEHLLARRPASLSGGERQRVAIGRALLAEPELLLLDEPLASLDAPRKAEILYYIERLRDEVRIPIVYVSHSIEEVVRLADTVVLLSDGRVVESGPVAQMAARIELRGFLGRFEGGAVLDAVVAEQDLESGLARLAFAGGSLYAPDVDALVGERVRVRIRARDVALATEKPRAISMLNVISGTVAEVGESAGASVDVRVEASGASLLARVTRKSVADLALAPGRPVFALVKAVAIDRHSVGYA